MGFLENFLEISNTAKRFLGLRFNPCLMDQVYSTTLSLMNVFSPSIPVGNCKEPSTIGIKP